MSETVKDGGQAFPHLEARDPQFSYVAKGMTLRDWFAGQALVGMLTNGFMPNEVSIPVPSSYDFPDVETYRAAVPDNSYATLAYRMADAMLSARDIGEQS